jgi:excisionase family DNA binding protein
MTASDESDVLLTPAQAAAMFAVDAKTVARWAKHGKVTAYRTLGGHRRFREADLRRLLEATREGPAPT